MYRFEKVLHIRNQLIFFCITITLTMLLGMMRRADFFAKEESPSILALTPLQLKKWGADPTVVTVGMHILNFPEFSVVGNKFVFDGIVWFEYDPAHVSTETISKFSFEKGEIIEKSPPDSKLINQRVLTLFKIRVRFTSNIDYTYFPMDDHRIYITFLNTFVNPSDVMFYSAAENFIFADNIYLVEWEIVNTSVRHGYQEAYLEKGLEQTVVRDSKVVFAFDIKRTGVRQILLIMIPLFLIFFISLFSFGFAPVPNQTQISAVASGGIASLIAYRFVIQNLSPQVGYFMLGDHIFTLFLVFAFIVLFMALYVIYNNSISRPMLIARITLFFLFHIILMSAWYYFLFIWGR